MTRKQRRLILISGALGVLAVAVALMLNAFRDSIVFFNSPSDVAEKRIAAGTRIRLLVKAGSLVRGDDLKIRFDVTDGNREITVAYQGVLPDLFREGQGSSPRARWMGRVCSRPIRSWPSTMRLTCRRR